MFTILLVEDDEVDAEAIHRIVKHCSLGRETPKSSVEIVHVTSFSKSLEALDSHPGIDVVLLDLHLPDGHGVDLVRRLSEATTYVPIIVLTGLQVTPEEEMSLVRAGAQDYIPKNKLNEASLTRSIQYAIERHHLINRVHQQAAELKAINNELETFTYIVSHDLRSPLVNLKGFSMELKRSIDAILPILSSAGNALSDDDRQILEKHTQSNIPKALKFVAAAAEKMDRLTSGILQLSRLGRRQFTFEEIDTKALVEHCLEVIAHQIKTTRTTVEVGALPLIIGDRMAIEQVFSNLLDNAVKYLEPGRPGNIRISATQTATHTAFTVADNGRGIAPDDLHKVFEAFRRAGDVENIAGEGMGMPFVRAILKRHDGAIRCDSDLGKGTAFHFTVSKNLPFQGKEAHAA